jgi:hypothetical protein
LALPCLLYFFILILTTGNEREILLKGVMSMSVSSPPVHVYTRSILWCKIWGKCESQNSTTFSLVFLGTFISQPTPNFLKRKFERNNIRLALFSLLP